MDTRKQLFLGGAIAFACAASAHASTAPAPECPIQSEVAASNPATPAAAPVSADDIPVAHTPPGGYRDQFPRPVLAACTEPIVSGAPDLRGLWKTLRAE